MENIWTKKEKTITKILYANYIRNSEFPFETCKFIDYDNPICVNVNSNVVDRCMLGRGNPHHCGNPYNKIIIITIIIIIIIIIII